MTIQKRDPFLTTDVSPIYFLLHGFISNIHASFGLVADEAYFFKVPGLDVGGKLDEPCLPLFLSGVFIFHLFLFFLEALLLRGEFINLMRFGFGSLLVHF